MTDPHRLPEASGTPRPGGHADPGGSLRPVLWVVLVISLAANAVLSSAGISELVGAVFVAVTAGSAVALIVHHYRYRRG